MLCYVNLFTACIYIYIHVCKCTWIIDFMFASVLEHWIFFEVRYESFSPICMLCRVFHTVALLCTKNRRRDFLIAHAAFYAVTQENHSAQNRWQVVNLTDRKGGPVVQGPTTTVRKVTGGAQGRPWPFCTAAVVMAMWVLAWEVWDAATTENVKFGVSSLSKNNKNDSGALFFFQCHICAMIRTCVTNSSRIADGIHYLLPYLAVQKMCIVSPHRSVSGLCGTMYWWRTIQRLT